MISPKEEIVQLILSLDTKEKRYFKRRYGGTKDYILLFDYILVNKVYSVPDIIEHIYVKGVKNKRPTSGYISVVRKSLKTKILSALRSLYSSQGKSYDLLTRSMNIDILLDKGLHDVAKHELTEAKDTFLKGSFPVERLLLLRRESLLQYYENYKFTSEKDIEQVYDQRIVAAEQLVLEVKLARILSMLSYCYHTSSTVGDDIKRIQNEPILSDYSVATEFSTQYLFCWIQAQIEEFKGNPEGSFLYFEKTMSLWLDNQHYIDTHPRMYLGACFTYLKYLLQQKMLSSNVLARVNFDDLLKKVNGSNLSPENLLQHAQIFHATKFLRLCIENKFEQVYNTIDPVLREYFNDDQATDFYQIMISFLAAVSAFEFGDFKMAEKHFINSCILFTSSA